MADLSIIEIIQEQAERLINAMRDRGVSLSYDEKSVEWLDGYIEELRQSNLRPETREVLFKSFSSFLGECIRHEYGGQWKEIEGQWGIQLPDSDFIFSPFSKVKKQFVFGSEEESILSFYKIIPALRDNPPS